MSAIRVVLGGLGEADVDTSFLVDQVGHSRLGENPHAVPPLDYDGSFPASHPLPLWNLRHNWQGHDAFDKNTGH